MKKRNDNYYGIKYGTFSWVRGTIDIYDMDDVNYVRICLDKIKKRLQEEENAKK